MTAVALRVCECVCFHPSSNLGIKCLLENYANGNGGGGADSSRIET